MEALPTAGGQQENASTLCEQVIEAGTHALNPWLCRHPRLLFPYPTSRGQKQQTRRLAWI